jgi:hypothetical protein
MRGVSPRTCGKAGRSRRGGEDGEWRIEDGWDFRPRLGLGMLIRLAFIAGN